MHSRLVGCGERRMKKVRCGMGSVAAEFVRWWCSGGRWSMVGGACDAPVESSRAPLISCVHWPC